MAGLVGLDGVVEVGLGWWFRWERLAVGALVSVFGRWWFRVVFGIRGVRFLVCWCCFGCVGSACPACVALCCSALPCVRFVCSGRDELIVPDWYRASRRTFALYHPSYYYLTVPVPVTGNGNGTGTYRYRSGTAVCLLQYRCISQNTNPGYRRLETADSAGPLGPRGSPGWYRAIRATIAATGV